MQNRIAASREYCGLTRQQLADTMRITAAQLTAWENGEASPSLEQMVQLSNILGLSIDFLLCRDSLVSP